MRLCGSGVESTPMSNEPGATFTRCIPNELVALSGAASSAATASPTQAGKPAYRVVAPAVEPRAVLLILGAITRKYTAEKYTTGALLCQSHGETADESLDVRRSIAWNLASIEWPLGLSPNGFAIH